MVRVTSCAVLGVPTAWLPKARLAAERVTAGPTPVPLRTTVCGPPAALSLMTKSPLVLPVTEGLKVTLMVQFAPAATLDPQPLVCAKSAVGVMLLMVKAALPLLARVIACAELVVPTR